MHKYPLVLSLFLALSLVLSAQSMSKEVVMGITEDGETLYKLELITRHSADILYEKGKMEGLDGYLAYQDNGMFHCIYWRGDGMSKVVSHHFSGLNPEKPKFIEYQQEDRALNVKERVLAQIKDKAYRAVREDEAYFNVDRGVTLNLHLLEKENRVFAYFTANQRRENTIPLGNDFRLTFDTNAKLLSRARIRSALAEVPTDVQPDANGRLVTFHSNVEVGPPVMGPTDICNLLLYSPRPAIHEHHMTSKLFICIYDVGKRSLLVKRRGG